MTVSVSERDILDIIGETDPLTVARILAIAPGRDELEQAACADTNERAFGEEAHLFGTERVEQVREILAERAAIETDDSDLECRAASA